MAETKEAFKANILINYVTEANLNKVKPDQLSAVCDLAYEGKIDNRTLRRCINDRIVETKCENEELDDFLNWKEIKAMAQGNNKTIVCPAHSNF